ncbi:MAG: cereblon family protein [Desulfobulbus sp.]|nr:cereblon family protein [Desulfobulbus sp.]
MWPITATQPAWRIDPCLGRAHPPVAKTLRPPADRPDGQAADQDGRAILCAVCNAAITRQQQARAVNGEHEHAFFNPAGIAFAIRCFHTAPGTVAQGESSSEFTWFPGYRWRIALCATCRTHLGWRFTGDGSFYGLIADLLH